ncbi:hypothetical protein [Nocardiopsis salina]|uniref:hypothetical protein n=1 Tax=Nocardiopsis salina TaxID=245836 RepID=UPI00034744EC|nr:hypothetical protein [Nocardiopsis salina]
MPLTEFHPLRRRLIGIQMRAQARPVGTAVVQGAVAGLVFGGLWFLQLHFGLLPRSGGASTAENVRWGVVTGVFFGLSTGVWSGWFGRRLNPRPPPVDTGAERVVAARGQLKRGRLGGDTETDRLTVHFAGQLLRTPWMPKTMGVLFVLGAALNWVPVLTGPSTWINVLGAVMFTVAVGSVVVAHRWMLRRRALAERVLAEAEVRLGQDRTTEDEAGEL